MRRTYSLDFKYEVIKQALEVRPFSLVARKYKLSIITISRWVREYKEGKYLILKQENPTFLEHSEGKINK